jgi:hypothetical protein
MHYPYDANEFPKLTKILDEWASPTDTRRTSSTLGTTMPTA